MEHLCESAVCFEPTCDSQEGRAPPGSEILHSVNTTRTNVCSIQSYSADSIPTCDGTSTLSVCLLI